MLDLRFKNVLICVGFDIVYINGDLLLRFLMGILGEIFDEIKVLNILEMDFFV